MTAYRYTFVSFSEDEKYTNKVDVEAESSEVDAATGDLLFSDATPKVIHRVAAGNWQSVKEVPAA